MPHFGDLLTEMLIGYGITHVFGQPGGQTVALYDGIARRPRQIRHILVRDERSAGYAADAFARLTGRPGVCDVTVGPGATKLADGFVESYNASVPVIALVGELPRDWAPYRSKGVASQGFDQVAFFSTMTKAVFSVPTAAALPDMVRSAFRTAVTGRPGPVALIVPHDIVDPEWNRDQIKPDVDDRYQCAPAFRPIADRDALEHAAALLRKAQRPMIVAGGGVLASDASKEVATLAEKTGAVVATSFSGKGTVDETATYAVGVLNPLGTTESLELARRADLLFWIGCKVGQNTSHNWALPLEAHATIHLDIDASELGRTFRPTVALNGDAKATIAALIEVVSPLERSPWEKEVAEAKAEGAKRRHDPERSNATPIAPERVMHELAKHLSPDDIVISDASFSAGWIAAHVPARRPGRHFLFARGQGGLGYAVPAAIGAAAARPDVRVVTVSGDGGFSYALGELATHAQLGLHTVNLVLNNGSLAWLAMWQQFFFEGLRESVDLENQQTKPDFAAVGDALGCTGIRIEKPDQLDGAFEKATSSSRPVVIDIRVDPKATPIHGYQRRLKEGGNYPRPGTVYELPPWKRSPD